MPLIKERMRRLELLNRYLRSGWHTYEDIMQKLDEELQEQVNIRTLQNDFNELRSMAEDDEDPIQRRKRGSVIEFKYADSSYSYTEPLITERQMLVLSDAIQLLRKHDGLDIADELQDITIDLQQHTHFHQLEDRVYFMPQVQQYYAGSKYLLDILESCRNKTVLHVVYKTFSDDTTETVFHPILLKEYNSRWFVIGIIDGYDDYTIYALDRIIKLSPSTKVPYVERDFSELYSKLQSLIGVSITDDDITEVIFKVTNRRAKYLITKPIHQSQKVISTNSDYTTFCIKVIPNNELFALMLSYGSDLTICSPELIKNEMKNILEQSLSNYCLA